MMTVTPAPHVTPAPPGTPAPPTASQVLSTAWWSHLISQVLAVAMFIGAGLHPGWTPPSWASLAGVVAAPVLSLVSVLVLGLHHRLTLKALIADLRAPAADLLPAAAQVEAALPAKDQALAAKDMTTVVGAAQSLLEVLQTWVRAHQSSSGLAAPQEPTGGAQHGA